MEHKYYIAYGSNLSIRQMQRRCPDAKIMGTAVIPDYQLLFKGSKSGAYLTIEPKAGASVPVAIWKVSPTDEQSLDRYEGYPNFYYKKEMEVQVTGIKTGKSYTRTAFVYIMHEERPLAGPSWLYIRTCLEGYFDFGFEEEVLRQAYRSTMEGITK